MDRKRFLTAAAFTLALGAGVSLPAAAAEFELHPSIAVSEEFNDNVNDTASDRRHDFITRAEPGVTLLYRTPKLSADLSYTYSYRIYARDSRGDEQIHTLNARGSAELVDNFFFIDLTDTLRRVSLNVARDNTTDTLFRNQTDQNRAVFTPYLLWHPSQMTVVKTGYSLSDTRYWTVSGSTSGIDRQEHRGFADLTYEPLARLSLSAGYAFSKVYTDEVDYDQHDLSGGFRYEYGTNSFLFGGLGNSWQSFSGARDVSNLFWNLGITNDFGLLVGTLEGRVLYTEDPLAVSTKETSYTMRLERALSRGTAGFTASYSEFDSTENGAISAEEEANRYRTLLSAHASIEVAPRVNATLALSGDKVSGRQEDYPYRLGGSAGVSYSFIYDISAAFNYTYVEYRQGLSDGEDVRRTNRVLVALRKVF
jgi:hypothetical protein